MDDIDVSQYLTAQDVKPEEIQIKELFVNKNNKKVILVKNINGGWTMKDLVKHLQEIDSDCHNKNIGLIFNGKKYNAEDDGTKKLGEIGIKDKSQMFIFFRVHGGSQQPQNEGQISMEKNKLNNDDDDDNDGPFRRLPDPKKYQWPKGIVPSRKECCSLYISPNVTVDEYYAQICKCKATISPEAMYQYLKNSIMFNGKLVIKCGFNTGCNEEIPYDICAFVSQLSVEEDRELQKKLAEIGVINISPTLKYCPNGECGAICERLVGANYYRVRCPVCKQKDWCWICFKTWINKKDNVKCGNEDCDVMGYCIESLENCDYKTINGIPNVPTLRLCPQCDGLVNWESKCKHVKCGICNYDFCISCLKNWKDVGENRHLADTSSEKCPVAPVQVH